MPRLTKGPFFFSEQPNESKDPADMREFVAIWRRRKGKRKRSEKKRSSLVLAKLLQWV
jgi:hypothetical protein